MNKRSREIIDTFTQTLNEHVRTNSKTAQLLQSNKDSMNLVNELLGKAAEGGRLVSAVETDGRLLGFVSTHIVQPHDTMEDEEEAEAAEATPEGVK